MFGLAGVAVSRCGKLGLSLLVTLVLPGIPIGIELVNTAAVQPDTFLLTTVILAFTFLASAERDGYRTLYGLLAVLAILFDMGKSQWAKDIAHAYAAKILITVMFLHFTERVEWHIVRNRPFPERLDASHG
jgi:hypothetical protein